MLLNIVDRINIAFKRVCSITTQIEQTVTVFKNNQEDVRNIAFVVFVNWSA